MLVCPGLSQAKRTRVPSWRFRAELERQGFDEGPYFDHLLHLMVLKEHLLMFHLLRIVSMQLLQFEPHL